MPSLLAQTGSANRSAPSQEETVILNPFEVTTTKDTGYQASSSLAGTRLNTPLGDIGAPITVITKEFFQDTGVTDINELFLYTASTEGAGLKGNYSAAAIADEFANVDAARRTPQTATRIRGLAAADLTRDYFLTRLPLEEYNLERVDISRGPNAILFGLGSPAGVTNSTLLKPSYNKNAYKLELRYGDHDSYRGVIDLNQIVIPQKLAARLAVLNKETRWQQNPTFERDKRIFATVKTSPFKDTTLSANFERGKIKARRPIWTNPMDRMDTWWIMGKPNHDAARDTNLAGPAWPSATNPAPNSHFDFPTTAFQFASLFQQYIVINEVNSQTPSMAGWMGARNGDLTNPNTPGVIPPVLRFVGNRFLGELGNDLRHKGAPISVFNFRDQLLGGETGSMTEDFNAVNVTLEQHFLDRKVGIEVAYSQDKYADSYYEPIAFDSSRYRLSIDVNTTLIDGRANPNYGRPWVFTTPTPKWSTVENKAWRGTAYAKWDAAEQFKTGFGRWLGRHTLTGLVSTQETDSFDRTSTYAYGGDAVRYNLNNPNINSLVALIYVGPSLANVASYDQVHLDFNLTTRIPRPGESSGPIAYWDRNTASFKTGEFPVIEAWTAALKQRAKIESQAGILQSYWLQDMLVTTVGWRKDKSRIYSSPLAPARFTSGDQRGAIDLSQVTLGNAPTVTDEGEIITYSAVAKLPRKLELPLGLDASIHYSHSENFQPSTGRITILGGKLPSPRGETKEYGVTLSALKNRAVVKFNWYKTTLADALNTEAGPAIQYALQNEFQSADFWYQGLGQGLNGPGIPTQADIDKLINSVPQSIRDLVGYSVRTGTNGRPNGAQYTLPLSIIADTSDVVAKGLEIESTVNLTNNWRVAFNVAKQKTVKSNIAPFVSAYIASRRPVWDSLAPLQKVPLAPDPVPGSFGRENQRLPYFLLSQVTATEGRLSPDLRKWRFNFVNNYTFPRESMLKGVGVGGAWRWQDKAAIDYPLLRDAQGVQRPDVAHPWFAPSESQVDLWVSYARPILNNKVRWKLQFNVGDVFADKDGLIPVAYQPWGDVSYVRAAPPRTWFLTSTFEY